MSRCIDADALRDRLQNLGYDDWNQGATTTWAEAFSECVDMVEEMPTIEPRCEACEAFNKTRLLIPQPQRKKGKWINCVNSEHWKCNQCGCRAGFWFNEENSSGWEKDMSEWLSDFCPNCGAEMTEGEG